MLPVPTPDFSKAAFIDQVALTDPNHQFTEQVTNYLKSAGFRVDIYAGEAVTVDLYRHLPTQGYRLIFVRTHSTNIFNTGTEKLKDGPVFLFTAEPYSRHTWLQQQLSQEIGAARILYDESNTRYFAIIAPFVRNQMIGRFEETLIVLGGCQSLGTLDLAEALVERGASAVVGWDQWVGLDHNDQALLHLLKMLAVENATVEQAIESTMRDVGPDPNFGSRLIYYPTAQGDLTLQGGR